MNINVMVGAKSFLLVISDILIEIRRSRSSTE